MNKNEFIDRVAEMAGINKAEAARTVDAVFDAITDALRKGDDVRLVGFGTFSATKRPAREGRNPDSGFDAAQIRRRQRPEGRIELGPRTPAPRIRQPHSLASHHAATMVRPSGS